jgi:F-type H+-transporting ATPase subunit alpha
MSKVAGGLKADLSQYRELAAFAQFGSDLDASTQRQLNRGERLMELLKQPQYNPFPVYQQVIMIYAGSRGYLDNVPVSNIAKYAQDLVRYVETAHSEAVKPIIETGAWNDRIENALKTAIEDFQASYSPG